MDEKWWDRLWVVQLWRLHLHHVHRQQRLRHEARELRSALAWAQASAAEQTQRRLEAEDREKVMASIVAEMGIDAMAQWLHKDEKDQ
jgi:hypothetical protein